jgi:hypothetical protein
MVLERKIVNNFSEYLKFIQDWFGNNWEELDLTPLKEAHGIPNSYPAIVWIEETYDSDSTWGSGYSDCVHIIDKENVTILKKDINKHRRHLEGR